MFDSNQFFGVSAAGAFYPTTIDQSLRFEDGDTAYLSRTPVSAGNRKTFTWSGWVKRGNLGTEQEFLGAGASLDQSHIELESDRVQIRHYNGATTSAVSTSAVLRDTSAWYHIVVSVDTTQATASDRVKLYINGVLQAVSGYGGSGSASYPAQNFEYGYNTTSYTAYIGRRGHSGAYWLDAYLAEVHFTDGTAYDADDFGELKSGIWVPKSPSVTYGTNGFYLDFADGAAIGDDESGNANDWTANNLVASDVVPDSPTNNFCTLNPNDSHGDLVFKEGNLNVVQSTATTWRTSRASFGITSGKWYWEYLKSAATEENIIFGLTSEKNLLTTYIGSGTNTSSIGMGVQFDAANNNLKIRNGNSDLPSVSPYNLGASDVLQVAYDADAGKAWIGINNTWIESGDPASGTNQTVGSIPASSSEVVFPAVSIYTTSPSCYLNFGQDSTFAGNKTAGGNSDANGIGDFAYAPPSGYLALCTSNLPDPVIDPAQDATPEDYMNVLTYTGTGASHEINGLTFQPDWVWIKSRSVASQHVLTDVIRGTDKQLFSSLTNAEQTSTTAITSFDSDGFTLGTEISPTGSTNNSGTTYVAWNWKAGGTAVANTDGSINSQVSANTDAGFSIVGYEGAGGTATVGHGLSSAPEMIIVKRREVSGEQWVVWVAPINLINTDGFLELNTQNADGNNGNIFTTTAPTASVFSIGNSPETNSSGLDYISYCFHSVDGYSKVGSYVGNGSADGTFVYTGFRPKYILCKNASASSTQWVITDTSRSTYNVTSHWLGSNNETNEQSFVYFDILSNGFKARNSSSWMNGSGNTIIYLAFAEQPFKYSNAR